MKAGACSAKIPASRYRGVQRVNIVVHPVAFSGISAFTSMFGGFTPDFIFPGESMQPRFLFSALFSSAFLVACSLTLSAQTAGADAHPSSTKHSPFQPAAKQAPGAAPDKVWVNLSTHVYHCPGDRYYGRTRNGKYMTEVEAKAAGDHGPRGRSCFNK